PGRTAAWSRSGSISDRASIRGSRSAPSLEFGAIAANPEDMDDLVSTQWLTDRLGEPGMVVLDASAHLPDAGRDAAAEFASAHIPGARFLSLETFKDPDSPVPAALPTAAQFAAHMAELGVNDGDRVVIYDDSAVKTCARAWFQLGRAAGRE